MSRESGSEECHEKDEFAQDGKEDHIDEKEEPNSDELVNGKEEPSHDELMNGTQERSPDVLMNGTHEPSPDELFDGEEDPSIDELVYGDDPSFDEVIYEEEDPNPNELVCEEEGASLDELVCEEEGASLDELVCEEEDASLDELVCEEEDPHADELICEEEDPIPDELMCDEEDAVDEENASPEELICDEEYPNADELICEEEDPNSDDLIFEEEDPHPDDLICEEEIPHPDEDDFICEEEDPNPIDLICEEEDPSFHELICGEQDPSLHELFDGRDEPRPNARENPSPDGREDPRPDGREDPNLDARQDPSAGELFDGQNDQSPSDHTERKGERSPDGKEDQWNGKEEENMKRVNESRKEQSGSSSTESSRSRKRKADVAVFLLDPDEVLAKRETIGRTAVRIPAFLRNPWSVILTPDKGWDEPSLPNSNMPTHNFSQHRATPLPLLGWANRDEVWKIMLSKEQVYLRDKNFMERHPSLQPRMRSILLDWMMEVSEVYKLHRETYYLAQDFFDRYMATQRNITKTLLQLIGITSLFIAAKLEEIYPPKLYQFAYVTDGACTEEEILTMELIIMKALKWRLSPMTLVSWLNVYMQVAYLNDLYEEVLMPQYPQQIFVQVAELLDVCILDMGCFDFTYGVLAASALYHFSSTEIMKKVSGFDWPEVEDCVKWMVPFAMAVKEVGGARLKYFKGVPSEDMHNIQTHVNTINLLDKAYEKQAMLADERVSVPNGLLTPPPSDKKPSKEQE